VIINVIGKTIVNLCPVQRIGFVVVRVKFLDLHLGAKSYIEGLDTISNIVTNQ